MRNQTSDFRIPRFDALPLSHRDYGERGLLWSSYDTRPDTARMNNVDGVMFVGQIVDQIVLSNFYFAYTFYSAEVITTKLMIR